MIDFRLTYSWHPFKFSGDKYFFTGQSLQVGKSRPSHTGPAIYKWEGIMDDNRRGILIGETSDLLARLRQYRTGTQEGGNKYWRTQLLSRGTIYLSILDIEGGALNGIGFIPDISMKCWRLVIEQFLIAQLRAKTQEDFIIFNKT